MLDEKTGRDPVDGTVEASAVSVFKRNARARGRRRRRRLLEKTPPPRPYSDGILNQVDGLTAGTIHQFYLNDAVGVRQSSGRSNSSENQGTEADPPTRSG